MTQFDYVFHGSHGGSVLKVAEAGMMMNAAYHGRWILNWHPRR
jgi:hypothetical protein